MEYNEFKDKVIEILSDVTVSNDITPQESVNSLKLDDFDEIQCEIEFEKEFDLRQGKCIGIFDECVTVDDVINKLWSIYQE